MFARVSIRPILFSQSCCFSTVKKPTQVAYKIFNMNKIADKLENIPKEVKTVLSLSTANRKQTLKNNIQSISDKFRMHPADTGSAQVQSIIFCCFQNINDYYSYNLFLSNI